MDAIVSGEWLAGHLGEVAVVDVRWYLDGRSGREAYLGGHIPGAVQLDIDTDLSAPASAAEGRHPLPSAADFAAALGRVGIAAGRPVVAYDDAGGSVASRLWWMLHVHGEPVAVLDGGLDAWAGPLESGPVDLAPVEREVRPWPADRFVSADEVAAGGATIFDARTADRYARGAEGIDPRPGHVPGALSAPWAGNLDRSGRFLAPEQLRARFAAAATVRPSPTAVPVSRRVTTCWRCIWPGGQIPRSTRARGRSGAPTRPATPRCEKAEC